MCITELIQILQTPIKPYQSLTENSTTGLPSDDKNDECQHENSGKKWSINDNGTLYPWIYCIVYMLYIKEVCIYNGFQHASLNIIILYNNVAFVNVYNNYF